MQISQDIRDVRIVMLLEAKTEIKPIIQRGAVWQVTPHWGHATSFDPSDWTDRVSESTFYETLPRSVYVNHRHY